MIGTWRWNAWVGALTLLITLFVSKGNNEWLTSLVRSLYGFIIVFAAMYPVRYVLGTFAGLKQFIHPETAVQTQADGGQEEPVGTSVDLTTPDEDDFMSGIGKQAPDQPQSDAFTPLQPRKLVTKEKLDPELLAQSLRQMSEQKEGDL